MSQRIIEIYSAGCPACNEVIERVKQIACPSCDVRVMDMNDTKVAQKARSYGVRAVPAVAVNGKLADCCKGTNVDEFVLRSAGIGVPLS
jgi:hypothetical protein